MDLLGIDIGGTKSAVCVGDETGTVQARGQIPTHAEQGADVGLSRILELAKTLMNEQGSSLEQIQAIGISAPGPVSVPRGMMLEPPNMKGWVDVPLVSYFEKELGKPVFMNNDANTCVLAEWLFGTCKGARDLVYITLSTGLGGGIISNGKLVQGASDTAGEVGHHVLDRDGPPCPCGLRGCFELYCGGKNVADRLRERIIRDNIETSILDEAGGQPDKIDFRCFVAAVEMQDRFALEQWDEFTERLAQGLGNMVQVLNPEAILLGTIAIHTRDLLMKPLLEKIPRYTWRQGRDACRIMPSSLGDRIGDLSALAAAIVSLREFDKEG